MDVTSVTSIDQFIPISQARNSLSDLVSATAEKDYFVLAKKYKPVAAVMSISFFAKLLEIYQQWQKENDFRQWEKMTEKIPAYKTETVERDIANAIAAVRKNS
jgi:prevent-host-death family protein